MTLNTQKFTGEPPAGERVSTPISTPSSSPEHERYFATDHLMADLKGRSVRGGAVTIASQGVKFVLQLASTMILARLLTPTDFGLVAMVTAITGFVAIFKDAGLSMATIQRDHITHAQVSTLFWLNICLSLTVMLIVVALAPALAWFYDEPRLLRITIALAATFVFGGLTVQHMALLRRQMRFKDLAIIEVLSMAAGIATAITLAWRGFGYWALVGMAIVSSGTDCVLTWNRSGWTPGKPFRKVGVRPMLKFGSELTGAGCLNYIGANIDNVLVGLQLGPIALGIYERSYKLMLMPLRQLNPPLAAVAQPALARALTLPKAYRAAYLSAIEKIAYIAWPLIVVAIMAPDWVLLVGLGHGWAEAELPFQILLLPALVLPIWNSAGWVFVSQGRTSEHLRFHIIDSFIKVLSVVIGLYWGLIGLCIAVAVRYYLMAPVLFKMVGAKGPVAAIDFFYVLWRPAINALVIAFLLLLMPHSQAASPFLGLTLYIFVAFTAALLLMLTSRSGRRVLNELIRLRKHFILQQE